MKQLSFVSYPTAGMLRALALISPMALLASAPARAELDRATLVMTGAQVLKVEVHRKQGGYSLGSGVALGDGRLVTNCHVTRDGVEIHVLHGENRWRAVAQAIDIDHDLCVLRVPELKAEGVPLEAASDLKVGQSVTAVGYTGGIGIQGSSGMVVALHKLDGAPVIQCDNWFTSGASGGALFNDRLHLVGVLTYRLRGGQSHYFAAPAEWLRPLLDGRVPYREIAPFDTPRVAYWQKPATQQPLFLQAASLERDGRWGELDLLTARWVRSDAEDVTPWSYRGAVQERLGRLADAQRALEHAVTIEDGDARLWLRLGRLYARQGARDRVAEVRARLQTLAPGLVAELDQDPAREPGRATAHGHDDDAPPNPETDNPTATK